MRGTRPLSRRPPICGSTKGQQLFLLIQPTARNAAVGKAEPSTRWRVCPSGSMARHREGILAFAAHPARRGKGLASELGRKRLATAPVIQRFARTHRAPPCLVDASLGEARHRFSIIASTRLATPIIAIPIKGQQRLILRRAIASSKRLLICKPRKRTAAFCFVTTHRLGSRRGAKPKPPRRLPSAPTGPMARRIAKESLLLWCIRAGKEKDWSRAIKEKAGDCTGDAMICQSARRTSLPCRRFAPRSARLILDRALNITGGDSGIRIRRSCSASVRRG